jgi:hypothetical protein
MPYIEVDKLIVWCPSHARECVRIKFSYVEMTRPTRSTFPKAHNHTKEEKTLYHTKKLNAFKDARLKRINVTSCNGQS